MEGGINERGEKRIMIVAGNECQTAKLTQTTGGRS